MFKNLKKQLSIILISALLLVYILPTVPVFAEDLTPTPTDIPAQTQVDNSTTTNVDTTTTSDSGNNTIGPTDTPTPTPDPNLITQTVDVTPTPTDTPTTDSLQTTPTDTPTQTPDPGSVNIDNSAVVSSDISSNSNSGLDSITTPTPTPTEETICTTPTQPENQSSQGDSGSSIQTGDAAANTNIENAINTTSVNSDVIYQTINIVLNENADINLSDPIAIAASALSQKPDDLVITVAATSINNFAFVSNDIISNANTGQNIINGVAQDGSIQTGNAYSIVSLLNKVNVVVINSQVHIVSINIYGDLNGNIILPDMNTSVDCSTCGISLIADNQATVENNVNSTANTGQNSITASGDAAIITGNAGSQVDTLNLVNTSVIGSNIQALYINTFGGWDGSFIGWGDIPSQDGGASLALINTSTGTGGDQTCSTCTGDISIKNNATVINNVSSSANTGSNTIFGKNSSITTGNAYSIVSIINLVNSNFINSFGFIGFINIFGRLHGNIGGKAEFAKLNNVQGDQQTISNQSDKRQDGGKLEVSQSNNVGAHVLPGDTVTFFVNVKNTGSGKVYEAKLKLYLINKDGQDVGGAIYDLGAIDPGQTVKVTTGLVLSKKTLPGEYTARAYAEGLVGEENNLVSAQSDSLFNVFGPNKGILAANTFDKPKTGAVLGEQYPPKIVAKNSNNNAIALYALLDIFLAYILLRVVRDRKRLSFIFKENMSIKSKLNALRLFLF